MRLLPVHKNETATVQDESADSNTGSTGSTTRHWCRTTGNFSADARFDNYRTYLELFVYSFYDSDGDGVGSLQGSHWKSWITL